MAWTATELRLTVDQYIEMDALRRACDVVGRSILRAAYYTQPMFRQMKRRGLTNHTPKKNLNEGMLRHWITRKGRVALDHMNRNALFLEKVNARRAEMDREWDEQREAA